MSHPEQVQFVKDVRTARPAFFEGGHVLELGSRNVNGSVRDLFHNPSRYVGLDCTPGPCVDVVCLAHEYDSAEPFDVVISCEAFEHDPYLADTLRNAMCLLRSGGLFVATAASPARKEHGTHRSTGSDVYGPDPDYYAGVNADWLYTRLSHWYLDECSVTLARDGLDVYASGIRRKRP